ncbi:hypothetical protein PGT21_014390 [Puccinia graminis f. sp. tritici]|uniref:Uncharacterized protein n=1 Tax=Puccinia graminis f. sp. tritici TaxID=56615 RepID=A0A5B0LNE3_PUCGR|nr:hypothetical protein PGT21_014390 [Puccinia graminis f. sp. tritici]KAA1104981.1 hypothetical protein PGTUg99_014916 [Puccinia graminis f. sp. tritici]
MANPLGGTNRRRFSSILSSAFLLLASPTLSADPAPHPDSSQPRWGQASLLLSDNSLLVYGGKSPAGGGYTFSSSPNTDDLISLSLNSSFSTTSPPWQYLSGSRIAQGSSQLVSYATLGLLVEPTAIDPGIVLSFGGDVSSSPNLTGTDSSWIINLPPTGPSTTSTDLVKVTQQDATWAQQPMRRVRHTLISASSPTSLRLWALGGQKGDGSQTVLNELWQYAAPKSTPLQGSWSQCSGAPTPTFDHASVAMLDSSNQLRIYAMGGVGPNQQALEMSNLYRFTPDLSSDTCTGRWETLQLHTSSVPTARRGHSIVSLSPTQILLYGGASADGERVYSDLWLLDLSAMSWSNMNPGDSNSPGARWGHTMVRVGSNVVVAFGFGSLDASQAAPSNVGVYDLEHLKWTNSYSLSSKADGQSSAVLQVPGPADSAAQNPYSWQVPGPKDTVRPLPIPSTGGPAVSSSTTKVLGITLGIFGALIIGVGSVLAYRYQKKIKGERAVAANAYKQKAYGPDFGDGDMGHDDDKVRLVNQEESLHAPHSIPRAWAGMSHRLESNVPGPLKTLAGVGVGVRALWPHKRHDKHKERFDILADEESEVWVCTDSASLSGYDASSPSSSYNRDRPLKKYDECCHERVRLPPPPPVPMSEVKQHLPSLVTTRGGLRIWDGIDDPPESQYGFGTSTSFLGASLAPWSDDGRGPSSISEYGQYEYMRAPSPNTHSIGGRGSSCSHVQEASGESSSRYDPFADPYHREEEGGHHTREGTGYSTVDLVDSPQARNATADPFNNEAETADHWGHSGAGLSKLSLVSPPGNPLLSPKHLERGGSWWDRLRYGSDKHGVVDHSPGAIHPIRDPTPAPPIPPINRSEDAHPAPTPESVDQPIDEHGRCRNRSSSKENDEGQNNLTQTSQTSNKTASTATSSMIEAATAHMTVVQRLRTIDSSRMSDSSSVPTSFQSQPSLSSPTIPESQLATPTFLPSPDSLTERPLSPRPKGPRPNSPILVCTTPHSSSILTLVDPLSPSDHQPQTCAVKRPPAKRTQTAGSTGVRAMVKQFENPPVLHPPSSDLHHPKLATKSSRPAERVKVERSLVKKPLLFVANPDK